VASPCPSYGQPSYLGPANPALATLCLLLGTQAAKPSTRSFDVQRARALLHKIRYDHDPPTTFAELAKVGPPNCTYIEINGRPGGENHKGSIDFWRREKPAFGIVAAKYKNANKKN
jgi:hypothetical protein